MSDAPHAEQYASCAELKSRVGQIVLVFQGGGALGAYQAGVYEALHEIGLEPDWAIGTSIGAINAALIAGNRFEDRLSKLKSFWSRVEHGGLAAACCDAPLFGGWFANLMTVAAGVPGFFTPNPLAFLSAQMPLGAQNAGYYSPRPLAETLSGLIDFSFLNQSGPRLTVGAANVRTGDMHYFDSREQKLGLDHILASGALPPAFPPVLVDGDLYWDGGILSNTPVEAVFDDNPRRNSLVFSIQMWHPRGPDPDTMQDVLTRQKDVQYASRTDAQILRQKQIHRLRHIITELASHVPEAERKKAEVAGLAAYGCVTRMHVVRLLAPPVAGEDHAKDIDFSAKGIATRWQAGLADTRQILAEKPWEGDFDPLEGFILHEHATGAGPAPFSV